MFRMITYQTILDFSTLLVELAKIHRYTIQHFVTRCLDIWG